MHPALFEYVPGRIWLAEGAIRYFGTRFLTRMSVVRLSSGDVWLHSPIALDEALRAEIERIGSVRFIVAPGTFHHLFVADCQRAFPQARTYVCPGLETKRPELHFDAILSDDPEAEWSDELDQVVVGTNRVIREVAFFDRPSRTLILVDVVENFRPRTPGTNLALRLWMRAFGMWGRARPAPEYRMFTRDRAEAGAVARRILAWDFERVVLAHGELIEHDAHEVLRDAWSGWLKD